MSDLSKDLRVAFPGDDGIGASFNRDLDAWVLYTTPKCERFGQIDGYDPKRIDAVLMALRAAFTPAPPETMDTCQGWQPMGTAPLDGKHCILSVQEGAFIVSVQGFYHGGKWIAVHRDNVQPLAWMPNVLLPDALCPPSFRNDALSTGGGDHG